MKAILGKTCLALLTSAAIGVSASAQAAEDCPLPGNLRVVIGSTSTGGDTYQVSSMVVDQLAEQLDINAKVDAVGVMPGFQALERSRHGNTIMIFHDGSYLGHLYGVNGYPDIFSKFVVGPTIAINPGKDTWNFECGEGVVMDGNTQEHVRELAPVIGRMVQ